MRAVFVGTVVLGCAASIAACAHEEVRPAVTPQAPEPRGSSSPASGPAQYLVADPSPRGGPILALGASASSTSTSVFGLVVDRSRIVVGRGEPRVAVDGTDAPITGATRIPGRFGGGFLFWTERALYRADAFDAPLKPLARVPEAVTTVSFASKFLLVRTQNGERWGIALPSGERTAIEPLGVADVESLDDGRSLAFNDQGAAFASTDGGDHWADVTAQMKSSPERVAVVEGELWIFESGGGALRLEPDGHLSAFDKQPPETPPSIRPRDPKWRGPDSPLRAAFHEGAAIDDSTALVLAEGDLVRVDVHTGEIVSVVAGRLPPDARCEAVPASGDVLFACTSRGSSGTGATAFVVSHTLSGDMPTVEQSFGTPGQFYAGGDGGLAFAGPCGGSPAPTSSQDNTVCVRQPGGSWQEHDLSALQTDGGTGDVRVMRWVPRADGRVVALVDVQTPGIYDPSTGSLVPLPDDARDVIGQGYVPPSGYGRHYRKPYVRHDASAVDFSWSFTSGGALRGWQRHGGMVEIGDDGRVHRSPFAFEVLAAGPYALGRAKDGRLYQSNDHGATWTEVAAPPSGAGAVEMRGCTTAGCDLGAFYRVGWSIRPPRIDPPPTTAPAAPEVRRARALELSCRPVGSATLKVLPRTASSPEDLGLGMTRLPVANESGTQAYLRNVLPRQIINPLHDGSTGGDGGDAPSIRALLSGYQTSREQDVIEVMGPNKNAAALRRPMAYVAAFDPLARIGKSTIAMSDVLAVGRGAGMTTDEILSEDMTEAGNIVPVTPVDANAPSDIAFHNPRGLLALVRGERTRLAMRAVQNDATVVSGVSLGGDEAAFLEVESSGVGHVFKIGAGGTTDLFDISPTVNDAAYYPANPDAIAVGPKSEIGVVRTASGSDPSSSWDPAIVIVPAMPPSALAPWSQLRLADDPACKEPGWRTTLQVIAPWVRVSTPELRVEDAPMLARVKWNDKRVCLEGIEAKLPNVTLRVSNGTSGGEPLVVATWLVAKGSTFARVGVSEGVEWRQPLECTIVPAPPPSAPTASASP